MTDELRVLAGRAKDNPNEVGNAAVVLSVTDYRSNSQLFIKACTTEAILELYARIEELEETVRMAHYWIKDIECNDSCGGVHAKRILVNSLAPPAKESE